MALSRALIASLDDAQRDTLTAMVRMKLSAESQAIFVEWFWPSVLPSSSEFTIKGKDAMQWLEIEHQRNFKRICTRLLDEGKDYIVLVAEQKDVGRPAEEIYMTPSGFKKVAVNIETDKGRRVREYYLQLEDVVMTYILKEQSAYMTKYKIEHELLTLRLAQQSQELKDVNEKLSLIQDQAKKNAYEMGEAVYVWGAYYGNQPVSKIGKSRNRNEREDSYRCHNIQGEIVHSIRCRNMKLIEDMVMCILRVNRAQHRNDWFAVEPKVVIEVAEAANAFIEGCMRRTDIVNSGSGLCSHIKQALVNLSREIATDAETTDAFTLEDAVPEEPNEIVQDKVTDTCAPDEDNVATQTEHDAVSESGTSNHEDSEVVDETMVDESGIFTVASSKDINDYDAFIEDCFDKNPDAKCSTTHIYDRYRLWSRSTGKQNRKHVKAYIQSLFTPCLVPGEDNIVCEGFKGLSLKPLPDVAACDSDSYKFYSDRCVQLLTGRLTVKDMKHEFVEWKRSNGFPHYKLTSADKSQLNLFFSSNFLYCVLYTGQDKDGNGRLGGGFHGVSLKGKEDIGKKKKNANRRVIYQYDPKTWKIIRTFECLQDVVNEYGANPSAISNSVNRRLPWHNMYFTNAIVLKEKHKDLAAALKWKAHRAQ